MWRFTKPNAAELRAFLAEQRKLEFTYREVGASCAGAPAGFQLDHYRVEIGRGRAAFDAACEALGRWRMFPAPWMEIQPADAPIEVGTVVAVLVRAYGVWWLNVDRIVYVVDRTDRNKGDGSLFQAPRARLEETSTGKDSRPLCFGFAYGTLPGHVECGEERFSVECDADDRIWYDIRAFSRPRFWLARLGYPLVRRLQRRFVRESQQAMRRAVAGTVSQA